MVINWIESHDGVIAGWTVSIVMFLWFVCDTWHCITVFWSVDQLTNHVNAWYCLQRQFWLVFPSRTGSRCSCLAWTRPWRVERMRPRLRATPVRSMHRRHSRIRTQPTQAATQNIRHWSPAATAVQSIRIDARRVVRASRSRVIWWDMFAFTRERSLSAATCVAGSSRSNPHSTVTAKPTAQVIVFTCSS